MCGASDWLPASPSIMFRSAEATSLCYEQGYNLGGDLLRRLRLRWDRKLSAFAIKRLADGQKSLDFRQTPRRREVGTPLQSGCVGANPLVQSGRVGLQPDGRVLLAANQCAIVRPQHGTAAERSDQIVPLQEVADHGRFQVAERLFAPAGKNLANRPAGAALQLLIGVDKRHSELCRNQSPH